MDLYKSIYKFIKKTVIPIIVPLIIGFCSINVAKDANEIAERQALITVNSYAPKMDIYEMYNNTDDINEITISVLDGNATNLQTEVISFFDIKIGENKENEQELYNVVQIPFKDYYFLLKNNNSLYGQTDTWEGHSKNEITRFLDIEYWGIASYQKKSLQIKLHSYVKVSYLNILGEKAEQYYSLVGNTDYESRAVLMDKTDGEQIFTQYADLLNENLCLFFFESEIDGSVKIAPMEHDELIKLFNDVKLYFQTQADNL